MAGHTPGPWRFEKGTHDIYLVVSGADHKRQTVAKLQRVNLTYAQTEANARLIAAAPDLLEVLKVALSTIHTWHDMADNVGLPSALRAEAWRLYQSSPEIKAIDAAIAKAEGRG